MSELYICIDCELTSSTTEPTELDTHGLCLRCKSSSVIACSTLQDLARRHKQSSLDSVVRETPTDQTRLRWQAIKDQRRKSNEVVRDYLSTLEYDEVEVTETTSAEGVSVRQVLNASLKDALTKWDGWAYAVHYPWEVEDQDVNPVPGKWVVELVSGTKNGPRWFVVIDDYLNEVRSFLNGID